MTDDRSKIAFPLSLKFSIFVAIMSLVIGGLIVFSGYQIYSTYNTEQFIKRGETVASAASSEVDWDKISDYYVTGVEDEEYVETLEDLRALAKVEGAKYIYVLMAVDDGFAYIYDTDEGEGQLELGHYETFDTFFDEENSVPVIGEGIDPFIIETDEGYLISNYFPAWTSDGLFAGYLGVDYAADHLVQEQNDFLIGLSLATLLIAVVVTIVFYIILRVLVVRPIDKMAGAANKYGIKTRGGVRDKSIEQLDIKSKDELGSLANSLKRMDRKITTYVTELEEANERAASDSMTGLLNREAFKERVSTLLNGADKDETHAFIMIDLDNFKSVNDTWGHVVGDDVILATAGIIKSKFRTDDLVARMGGDEFAVYYRRVHSLEEVEERLKDLTQAIRSNEVAGEVSITVSIGASFSDASSEASYQDMYVQADNALYEAKNKGRNSYVIL